jgi:CheY-like chemotaxis protein
MHGGRVDARSEGIGKGSEFTIWLPIVTEAAGELSENAGPASAATATQKHRILAVDDNRDAADSLAVMLAAMGHETRTAYDGDGAVQTAASFRPELVLLDIGLPKLNGYEVARQIRQQPWGREMMLIALTGWGQDDDKRRSMEAGFNDHLTKPLELAALMRLIAHLKPVTLH